MDRWSSFFPLLSDSFVPLQFGYVIMYDTFYKTCYFGLVWDYFSSEPSFLLCIWGYTSWCTAGLLKFWLHPEKYVSDLTFQCKRVFCLLFKKRIREPLWLYQNWGLCYVLLDYIISSCCVKEGSKTKLIAAMRQAYLSFDISFVSLIAVVLHSCLSHPTLFLSGQLFVKLVFFIRCFFCSQRTNCLLQKTQ